MLGGWGLWLIKKNHLSYTLYKTSLNEGIRGGGGVKAVTGTVEYIHVLVT